MNTKNASGLPVNKQPVGIWLSILAPVILVACATTVSIPAQFAPRALSQGSITRIAVLDFSGRDGGVTATELEGVLVQAMFQGRPYFTIVDRVQTRALMNELGRSLRGEIDPATAAEFGRTVGAEGILSGSVTENNVSVQTFTRTHKECTRRNADKKCIAKREVHIQCQTHTAVFSIVPRLIDVETARVVYGRPQSGRAQDTQCGNQRRISRQNLLAQARRQAVYQIRMDIAPYEQQINVALKRQGDGLPQSAQASFVSALAFADAGRMDRACQTWKTLLTSHPNHLALVFNSGVCAEVQGNLREALRLYTHADERLTKPDRDINIALARVKTLLNERQALQEINVSS